MAKPGMLIYKCRRCGQTEESTHVPDTEAALVCLVVNGTTPQKWGPAAAVLDLHVCGPGVRGVLDIIGARDDKP